MAKFFSKIFSLLFLIVWGLVPGVLGFVPSAQAGTATLKIDPPQGTFYVGSSFDISIILDTGEETINAVETELRFPPNILQVTTPTAARSFIAIWTSPPTYSNQEGFVRFQGGVPSPGLKTSQGIISTITFRAVQPGNVILDFKNSRVLLADGSGTNIFSNALGARYTIRIPPPAGPQVFSPTHPEYINWYRDRNVTFGWESEEGVTEYSWSLDTVPNGVPDTVGDGFKSSVTYENLADGILYFHIRAKKDDTWGGVTTFPVKIDTAPPAQFPIELDPKDKVTLKTRVLAQFRTTDALSGINRYEVSVVNVSGRGETEGSSFFIEAQNPFTLPTLPLGSYSVLVRAYDIAGNFQESSATLDVRKPLLSPFLTSGLNLGFAVVPWLVLFFVFIPVTSVLGFLVFLFWKRHHLKVQMAQEKTKGLGGLRERLSKELGVIQDKISQDERLRERFNERLKNIQKLAEDPSGTPQDETRSISSKSKGSGIVEIIVLMGIILSFVFFVSTPASTGNEEQFLPAPRILSYQVELTSNQLLYLTGLAPPDSFVDITIVGEDQEKIVVRQILANKNGEWAHLHDLYLQPGFYQVWVQAVTPTGQVTKSSEPISLKVKPSQALTQFGSELFLGVVLIFSLLIDIFFLGYIAYLWRSSGRLHERLKKEVGEVYEAVRVGFQILVKELEGDLSILEKDISEKGVRAALEKEHEMKKSLLRDFKRIERSIREELSDIEKFL